MSDEMMVMCCGAQGLQRQRQLIARSVMEL